MTIRPASDFPAAPYPGVRPAFSFAQLADEVHPLAVRGSDWYVGTETLPDWLSRADADATPRRRPLLAYGSNCCPAKIAWLGAELGLPGPVVVLRATCRGISAVWAAGHRVVDDQRPATITALPGAVEQHAVWLATDAQLAVLDECEGRGQRYRLVQLHTGQVELENGQQVMDPLAYVGLADIRLPLLVDGAPVRCADVPQETAKSLTGVAAAGDGLAVTEIGRGPAAGPAAHPAVHPVDEQRNVTRS